MCSVCCLFGVKENWDDARKFLGRMDFKDCLVNYSNDIDNVPEARFKKFRQTYLKNEKYNKSDV